MASDLIAAQDLRQKALRPNRNSPCNNNAWPRQSGCVERGLQALASNISFPPSPVVGVGLDRGDHWRGGGSWSASLVAGHFSPTRATRRAYVLPYFKPVQLPKNTSAEAAFQILMRCVEKPFEISLRPRATNQPSNGVGRACGKRAARLAACTVFIEFCGAVTSLSARWSRSGGAIGAKRSLIHGRFCHRCSMHSPTHFMPA